jgi:hypothetical protein
MFFALVEQQNPSVVLLPSFEEKIALRVEAINF